MSSSCQTEKNWPPGEKGTKVMVIRYGKVLTCIDT